MIPGKNILVYIEKDGKFTATACDKSCALHIETGFIEITDPGGSTNRRRLPTITDWTISGDCLVDYNRLISALYMQKTILARTRIQVRLFAQNKDGYALYSGYGYFQSVNETAAATDSASYSYVIVADGDLNITSTIPQDEDENHLLSVLMNDDNDLITDSNNDLIITP